MNKRARTRPLVDVAQKLFVGLPLSRHAASLPEGTEFSVVSVGDIDQQRIAPRLSLPHAIVRMNDIERFFIHQAYGQIKIHT